MAPLETQEQFERWLKNQPQEVCVAIATRSALRVFPFVTHLDRQGATQKSLALLTARCILISGVATIVPTPEISDAANAAAADANDAAGYAARGANAAAYSATDAAADAANAAAGFANVAVYTVNDGANAAGVAAYAAAYADTEKDLQDLMTEPLWDSPREPDWLAAQLKANPDILDSGPTWLFWRSWYQGFLIGEPLDWELQRRVALIDNVIWEAGPEAVAAEIAKIEAQFHLEQEIMRLKEQLTQASTAPLVDRKHNNPPPLDDEGTAKSEVITLIWADLVALDTEISKEEPDPGKIKQVAQRLWLSATKIATYCGNKIDTALEAAAKEIGTTGTKWAIRTGALYLAATQEGTQSVAKLAWQYAERLLSGG